MVRDGRGGKGSKLLTIGHLPVYMVGGLAWRYRVGRDQQVTLRRSRLILGWVTVSG